MIVIFVNLIICLFLINDIYIFASTDINNKEKKIKRKSQSIVQNKLEEIPILFYVDSGDYISDENFIVYFDENMNVFLDLKNLLSVLGINRFSIKNKEINYSLNGKNLQKSVEYKIYNNRYLISYSQLSDIFDDTEVYWDFNNLTLRIKTKLLFPKEFREKQNSKRENLSKEKQEVLEDRWKGFTPGFLNLGFDNSDVSSSNNNNYFDFDYKNQLLYGNFNLGATIQDDKLDVDNVNWTRSILDERKIVVGDSYKNTPFDIGSSSSVRGISLFSKNSWDSSLKVETNRITGRADNGVTVELYENGILKEYQIVTRNEYEFSITSSGGIRSYEVWIYNSDGSITKKKISSLSNNNILESHEYDYQLQFGKDTEYYYNPYSYEVSYGIKSNLTLGVSGYNAYKEGEVEDFTNIETLYKIDTTSDWGHLFDLNLSTNNSDFNENFYSLEFTSSNRDITNMFGVLNYENLRDEFSNESYDKKYYIKNSFKILDITSSLSYEREMTQDRDNDIDRYGATFYRSFFRGKISTSTSITDERSLEGVSEYDTKRINTSLTYNFQKKSINRFLKNIILNIDKTEDESPSYQVSFQKNKERDSRYSYYLSFRHGEDEDSVQLTFSYSFDNLFQITTNTNKYSETKAVNGIRINTAVDFSRPKKFYYTEYGGDSSVKGRVFVDKNSNNILDKGEETLENIDIVNDVTEDTSNKSGEFYLTSLSSNVNHRVRIKNENPDYVVGYKFPKEYILKTKPGGVFNLDIPVTHIKTFVGTFDFSSDFYLEDVEDFLNNSLLILEDLNTQKKKKFKMSDGGIISEIEEGRYRGIIKYNGRSTIRLKSNTFILDTTKNNNLEEYIQCHIQKEDDTTYKFVFR